ARRYRQHRRLPVRERFPIFGSLVFWLCLIFATACTILALARPVAAAALVRTAGVDLVILQDGSASMRTPDVTGDRWQRSIRFLRVLGESLAWRDDRIAMALFAHIAAPQVRLTKDPNTFFFFLDHLDREPPPNPRDTTPPQAPMHSALDRASLATIANAGGGEYLELDREGDREIANRIIDAARRRAGSRGVQVENEELYWRCLLAAAAFI